MLNRLRKQLELAEGRSEFVVVVVCDIRGFSNFSRMHESPDTAMFIKRFYLQLINNYFSKAAYVKTTGDGLLMIFRYSEASVHSVVESVINSCFSAINDFPKMFQADPMINFLTPTNLGFGISRGPACCLFSGRTILDYSGQLLNLASRLNDLARPRGIVIDGGVLLEVIPEQLRSEFTSHKVFVRGVAEDEAREVFCSKEVSLPSYALFPIVEDLWKSTETIISLKELLKMRGEYSVKLSEDALSPDKVKTEMMWPNPKLPGFRTWRVLDNARYVKDAGGVFVALDVEEALKIAKEAKLKQATSISFRIQYVPKKTHGDCNS